MSALGSSTMKEMRSGSPNRRSTLLSRLPAGALPAALGLALLGLAFGPASGCAMHRSPGASAAMDAPADPGLPTRSPFDVCRFAHRCTSAAEATEPRPSSAAPRMPGHRGRADR